MRQRVPAYYGRFCCAAGHCADSCCIGWEIAIDAGTLAFYDAQPEPWRSRFARGILRTPQGAVFRLEPGGRCPFLNGDNLCRIYAAFGPEHLCEICAQHPRFHNRWPGRLESGLGLACETAARLILSAPTPALFVEREVPEPHAAPGPGRPDEELSAVLEEARDVCFALLATPGHTAGQKLALCTALLRDVQSSLDRGSPRLAERLCRAYRSADGRGHVLAALRQMAHPALRRPAGRALLEAAQGCEAMAPAWPGRLQAARAVLDTLDGPAVPSGPFYENMAAYLFYRYLPQALWDGAPAFQGMKAVVFCLLTALLERAERPADFSGRARLAKDASKELEYCPANLDALAGAPFQRAALGLNGLASLLL